MAVAAWFVREVPTAAGREDALGEALERALARGRAAWPHLTVPDEAMVVAIARGAREADDPVAAIDELAIEDLHLAQACAAGDRAALDAFSAQCDAPMAAGLRQMKLGPDAVDDVIQDVRAKLFTGPAPRIATYSGRAALRSWARTIATRVAVDRIRSKSDSGSDDDALAQLADPARGPELDVFRRTYSGEFKEAFEEALATLEVRERNLLRHHYVDALTTDEIGALYGVHKTTAFRWLEAAREALSKRTRAGFQRRLKVMPAELDSILHLLQSQIDLSLSRVLAD